MGEEGKWERKVNLERQVNVRGRLIGDEGK